MSTILTNSVENINVKLQFNDEFRRFFIPPQIPFTDLESKIKSLLSLSSESISIKYKDEEGEWITISSDDELSTGLTLSGSHRLFRLLCTVKENQSGGQNLNGGNDGETEPKWKKYRDGNRNKKWKKNDERGEKKYGKRERFENEAPVEEILVQTPIETPSPMETPVEGEGGKRKGKKEKGEKKGKKNRNNEADEEGSSSESNSDVGLLTLEEIKMELSKLKEEEKILKEKVRGAKDSLKAVKDVVKEKRKDEKVQPDEILVLREEVTSKKEEKKKLQDQLKNTRRRMNKLREAAETKQV